MAELTPSTTATALDLIKGAMEEIRALRAGDTPSAEDVDYCLRKLNIMLDTWSAENLTLFVRETDSYALVAGTASFTIGPDTGDIDAARPDAIDVKSSFVRDASGSDYRLNPMTEREYNAIGTKATGNSRPTHLFYNPTHPTGTVYLYPPPEAGWTIYLVSTKPFANIHHEAADPDLDVNSSLPFPPGYREAIEANLAVRIAKGFGKTVDQETFISATTLKANLKSRNRANRPLVAEIDLPCGMGGNGQSNIYTGWE
jgi:hypothetical protein